MTIDEIIEQYDVLGTGVKTVIDFAARSSQGHWRLLRQRLRAVAAAVESSWTRQLYRGRNTDPLIKPEHSSRPILKKA